jgi:heme exporter protein D
VNWGSLEAFLAMGGYALYVWGAYAVSAVAIAAEVVWLFRRGRTLHHRLGLNAQQATVAK